jgi:hypothetical protein
MRDRSGTRDDALAFEPGTIITCYLQALEHGISQARLRLSDTDGNLADRVGLLLEGMGKFAKRDWKDPYLITPSWIELATRIKQFATTDRGKSNLLLLHIKKFISQDTEVVKRLKERIRNEDEWESLLESTLKQYFMFETDKFEFVWNLKLELSSRENAYFVAIVQEQLLPALEKLSDTPEGQQWHRAGPGPVPAPDLLSLLKTPHRILNQPVIILNHRPDAAEWNWKTLGEIGG